MKIRLLAGAAVAALIGIGMSAPTAAANPGMGTAGQMAQVQSPIAAAVSAVHATRHQPMWVANGRPNAAGSALLAALDKSSLDGLASGPELARRIRAALDRASSGDTAAAETADQMMSTAYLLYAQAVQAPVSGMTYADSWAAPRNLSPMQRLVAAAGSSNLAGDVAKLVAVNPLYDALRQAAYDSSGGNPANLDPRVLASLDRARINPFQKRYLMVDAASAKLYMIEDGRIVDSMRVIVGKADTQTPLVASTIYYATVNPYWHVMPELVRSLIAKNVLAEGTAYLDRQGYQVQPSAGGEDAPVLDPSKVDWRAVAEGRLAVRVRQLPGPANSMGQVKFGFPNADDIYLHDTPVKEKFDAADRSVSHGCVRLEDAPRLARFLLGRDLSTADSTPERHDLLPAPVPIYVTYLTALPKDGGIAFVDDVYGRDPSAGTTVASLR